MTRLEEMKALATEEAVKLKEYATKKEIRALDLDWLDPNNPFSCIYGLLTGDCNSLRAQELIIKCTSRVYDTSVSTPNTAKTAKLNGAPYLVVLQEDKLLDRRMYKWQSPIEMLIYDENGGEDSQAKLIAFLKDETQTLEL